MYWYVYSAGKCVEAVLLRILFEKIRQHELTIKGDVLLSS